MTQRKSERIVVWMSPDEVTAVDDWRFAHRVPTRGEALRRLVAMGLAAASECGEAD